jgi:hypothetical protein
LDEDLPVHKVERPSAGFPRGWILAGTVVGAMLLGALGSALYLSITNREAAANSVFESDGLAAGVVGEISEPPRSNPPAAPAPASNDQRAVDADQEVVASEASRDAERAESENDVRKPVARRVAVLSYPSTREERKAARRLAKQQQREFERENRRNRDLTRIREIFEGTQRP